MLCATPHAIDRGSFARLWFSGEQQRDHRRGGEGRIRVGRSNGMLLPRYPRM